MLLFTQCVNQQNKKPGNQDSTVVAQHGTIAFDQFAGIETCSKCHPSITNTYTHTAHFLTSQEASFQSIKGSFEKGKNSFAYDAGKIVYLEKQKHLLKD